MIVRDRPSAWRLFFILKGSILQRIKGQLLMTIGLSVLVTWAHGQFFETKVTLTPIPFSLIGLALAIFLGFRNQASYDRWWEGRKLWGALIVHARSLTRLMTHYFPDTPGRRTAILRIPAFAKALRDSLRQQVMATGGAESPLHRVNRPDALLRELSREVATQMQAGAVDPILAGHMEQEIIRLAEVQGGCERIRSTPLPFSYSLMLHRTAYLYCLMLPFGLVDTIGFTTPLVVGLIAYTFFGLDALGDEIEEPFGLAANDLPLDALCRRIEIDALAALGDSDVPLPLQPVDYFLS